MKVKLLNILTVCIVTLCFLSPAILVFSVVWGRHIELVKTQSLACGVSEICLEDDTLSLQYEGMNTSQAPEADIENSLHTLDHQKLTVVEQYQLAIILQWFFLLIPIFFGVGIIVYDRYLVYRAAVFQEQVEMLERLWRQSIEQ
ncbi:hypothetical protein [Calothrix sp. PCC 7507]|uniref:hypothetical protein n=1 Tax=Calothrix sp. PCC 7507 TaxID=99598 RepID=UPI00029F1D59|nr:hypothetical protein [Calothrix sp. PCC 7507]AFY30667.1 hypothetical protein Cal7507_0164 [Calothrix sp. PCC 7507]